jgi:prophage regulatory protein
MKTPETQLQSSIPETGFLRIWQIVGDAKRGALPIIPVSRGTWWAGVRDGRYPESVKLGPNTTVWRAEDIRALVVSMTADAPVGSEVGSEADWMPDFAKFCDEAGVSVDQTIAALKAYAARHGWQ